jgi:hypothetical protein
LLRTPQKSGQFWGSEGKKAIVVCPPPTRLTP